MSAKVLFLSMAAFQGSQGTQIWGNTIVPGTGIKLGLRWGRLTPG